jgi:ABC-2 type transport system ATP-binding protein
MSESLSIEATGLTKHFGNITAVDNLSLNIRRGEIYGFLGLNGAGKTTTIRMLLGMIKPGAGSISLFGTGIHPGINSIWQRVGYMVETPHAYPDLTVRENLEIIRRLRLLNEPDSVEKVIGELGLEHYADRRARNLSLGNAQRLGLAKALIHHPDLLILDEPANALDPAGIVEIRNLLHRLAAEKGVTIFVSSHILGEISRLATRIGFIHQGKLVKEIDVRELAEQEAERLVVSVRNIDAALSVFRENGIEAKLNGQNELVINDKKAIQRPEEIATILVRAGNPPGKLVTERGDLESYFLKLVGVKEGNQ